MDARRYILDEYADHLLYKKLASCEKNTANQKALEELSAQEHAHYIFWKEFHPEYTPTPSPLFFLQFRLMRKFFGLTFTVKFLERHEKQVIEEYRHVAAELPEEKRLLLEKIIKEEEEHENFFIAQIEESVIKYAGFIALGLADAIVEITGVHAGFLGVTSSTLFAGISGLIVGFSAAISMGSAAYLQAKQDPHRSPWVSAIITGISYIISVILLAVPYFLTAHMGLAFAFSILAGIALIGLLTFYNAIVFDRKFLREFLETVILMLATALITYFLGEFLGNVFGIEPGAGTTHH